MTTYDVTFNTVDGKSLIKRTSKATTKMPEFGKTRWNGLTLIIFTSK